MTFPVRDYIRSIDSYKPGKPLEELERELGIKDAIKLASNENPLGPSKKALSALKKSLTSLHRYPEGTGLLVREALAQRIKISSQEIILGNGSDEILDLAVKAILSRGEEAITADLTFAIYSISVRSHGGTVKQIPLRDGVHDLEAMAAAISPQTRIVFICNPNNPTGTIITQKDLEQFIARLPEGVLVVVDEAYGEYVTDPHFPNTVGLIQSGAPLLVLRTFSKFYGLAGLRIGYGLSHPDLIRDLNRIRMPFNTNALAQQAAVAALKDEAHASRSLKINSEGKTTLDTALKKMGLNCLSSQANFVYVDVGCDGEAVYQALLRQGVIVRLIEGNWFRISIGHARENRRFISALKKVLKERV